MTCVICKYSQTQQGKVSVTLERGPLTLVFKDVPAQVCENCGEQYVDSETTARLLVAAEDAAATGVKVEVRAYAGV